MADPRPLVSGQRGALVLRLALLRRIHTWLGLFIAPSLIFFAISGGMQLFALHDAHGGFKPIPIVEKLGELHKNQRFAMRPQRPEAVPKPVAAGAVALAKPDADEDEATPLGQLALKWLFALMAAGLCLSTGLGFWLSLTPGRSRPLHWGLVVAGSAIPVLLLLL
jgi:hypothetical protein